MIMRARTTEKVGQARAAMISSQPPDTSADVREGPGLSRVRGRKRSSSVLRTLLTRHVVFVAFCIACLLLISRESHSPEVHDEVCPPFAYDNGRWIRKSNASTSISNMEELRAAAGWQGCAGIDENGWQFFGFGPSDFSDRLEPFSWTWEPHPTCELAMPSARDKLQMLVDRGGILLVGDSLERQQFFQVSCDLYGHVAWRGEPLENAPNEEVKWHGATQHLLLNRNSTLVPELRMPSDFDFDRPLITFLAQWLPLGRHEISKLPDVDPSVITKTLPDPIAYAIYDAPMNNTIDYFVDPRKGLSTMLFSTGAHFSQSTIFPGASNTQLMTIMRQSLQVWYRTLAERLLPHQQVWIRAASPGHQPGPAPVAEVPYTGDQYQWRLMPDMNNILRDEMFGIQDPRFVWVGGERLARLRPDAHLNAHNDYLHFSVGTGVMEAWSRYMWHMLAVSPHPSR